MTGDIEQWELLLALMQVWNSMFPTSLILYVFNYYFLGSRIKFLVELICSWVCMYVCMLYVHMCLVEGKSGVIQIYKP